MIDRLSGSVLFIAIAQVVIAEWGGGRWAYAGAGAALVLFLALVTPRVRWSRHIFLAGGVALVVIAGLSRPDWLAIVEAGLRSGSFVAAFFVALAWLRDAAGTSPTIERCGRFLAGQAPGRRYLALAAGGHLFGLVLSYGAIALLGSLAERGARAEPNPEIRAVRTRRMLLAVQRGFITMTCWSPLTFSVAISTSIVPGSSWSGAVGYCLVSAFILTSIGWGLDLTYRPALSAPPPERPAPQGSWADLKPLLGLLVLLMASVGGLQVLTGIRAVAVVMVVVPVLSLAWIAIQGRGRRGGAAAYVGRRAVGYMTVDAPKYRSELVLLIMAGFIGTVASGLLKPLIGGAGVGLAELPGWAVLVGLVWLMPITGQLGMNPILAVYLIAPLLPPASALGLDANAIIVALTAGWAVSANSSPFTASNQLLAALGKVSAFEAGLKWNGVCTLLGAVLLSAWVVVVSRLL